jgi:putative phosphoesterase
MIAIISDIHSNLEALEIVLKMTGGCDTILNAGDIVGYNPNPNEAIGLLKNCGAISVLGNHDYAVSTGDTSGLNFYAERAVEWTLNVISNKNLEYLKKLKTNFEKNIDGKKISVFHGSPKSPLKEYVFPWHPDNLLKDFLKQTNADILILGHTHIPFIKKLGKKLVINPGSVGQPRDMNNKASYAFLDVKKMKAEIKRVKYDFRRTQEKMKKAGLPEFLIKRLEQGI